MNEVLDQLRDTQARLSSRAKRARTVLESIEAELAETATAVRVLERLASGNARSTGAEESERSSSAEMIMRLLGFGESEGKSPREIVATLEQAGEATGHPDYVRTTLWRLKQRGQLESADGKYWRPESERLMMSEALAAHAAKASNGTGAGGGPRGAPSQPTAAGSTPVASTPPTRPAFGGGSAFDDLDDDVPF